MQSFTRVRPGQILLAVAGLFVAGLIPLPSIAQTPTEEQIRIFQSLPPEQQRAILEAMGPRQARVFSARRAPPRAPMSAPRPCRASMRNLIVRKTWTTGH